MDFLSLPGPQTEHTEGIQQPGHPIVYLDPFPPLTQFLCLAHLRYITSVPMFHLSHVSLAEISDLRWLTTELTSATLTLHWATFGVAL